MFRWRERSALVLALMATTALAASPTPPAVPRFGFGTPATPEQIAGWDIDVRADGMGLPPGRGSVAEGQKIYDAKCASCHGTFGESTDYIAIAGGVGTLRTSTPVRTTGSKLNYATTLFDYIRRAMPFPNPKTLTDDEVYALTAYVLNLNDILPADAVLDRDSLPKLEMPNRHGFTTMHGFMRRDGMPDTHNVACMRDCGASVRVTSELPDHAEGSHGELSQQMRALGPVRGTGGSSAPGLVVAATAPAGHDLARKAGCLACHAVDRKVVGPAFKDVAARYAGDSGAAARLAAKIRAGGSGAWGEVPMPGQPQMQDGDTRALVKWILSGG